MTTSTEKETLYAAGRLAIAAGQVVRASVFTLSCAILELDKAVCYYDRKIMDLTEERDRELELARTGEAK